MKKFYSPFCYRTVFFLLFMLTFVRGWGQTTLVEWNFPDPGADDVADAGIAINLSKIISANGGVNTIIYTAAGATTRSISGANWSSGSGSRFWQVEFATTGYKTIKLYSKQRSSGTGPRDFKAQYRIATTGTWTDISGGTITVANNFTSGVLSGVSLPVVTENIPSVFVRWILTSNTGVNGSATQNGGVSNIDDIVITGELDCTPPTPTFTTSPSSPLCKGTDVTYTTESGKTNYVWNVPGILNTDYSIVSGSLGANSNTVTVKWLTGGSKTVTVGYTESNCASTTPASSTTTVSNATISPTATYSIPVGVNGNTLTVTEQSTATSRVWKYGTATGVYSTTTSSTGTTYTPNFATLGTYYVVCESTFACGVITSNEVVINVNAPSLTVAGTTNLFTYAQGQGPSAYQTLNVSGTNLANNIVVTVPNANWEISTVATFPTSLSSITINKNTTTHAVTSTPVHIRLKAGLPEGQYNFSTDDDFQATSSGLTRTIDLDGEVTTPVPFIDVKSTTSPFPSIQNGVNVPIGTQNTLWAARAVNTSEAKSYTIQNLGGSPLTISSVTIAGANPLDFTVSSPPPSSIVAGASATFAVTFSPTTHGQRNAVVRIANNSSNINPNYDINVQGTGNNAEIGVLGNGNAVSNGSTTISSNNNTLIGAANINLANPTTVSKDFVISNTGNISLSVSASVLPGTDASQFSIVSSTSSISAGGTGTITVTFAPTTSGVKNAIVTIANNDLTDGENPYTFAVQGNAVSFIACAPAAPIIIKSQDFEGTNPLTNTAKWTGSYTPSNSPTVVYVGATTGYGTGTNTSSTTAIDSKAFIVLNRNNASQAILTLDDINTSTYGSGITFSMRVGAYSAETSTNGMDDVDYVKVDVRASNAEAWKELIYIHGKTNNRWTFDSGTGQANASYNNLTSTEYVPTQDNAVTAEGYSYVKITDLPNTSTLQIRIRASSNDTKEVWAVDNIVLSRPGLPAEKTWNGTIWSGDGLPPTSTQKAIIADNQTLNLTSDLHVCECEVKTGATLNVGTHDDVTHTSMPANLIVEGKIINNGTIVLASDSNLQQKNSLAENVFSGTNFIVKRSAKMKKMDYTYWSSPVQGTGATGQRLLNTSNQNSENSSGGFSPTTPNNRIFRYNEPNDYFVGTTDDYFIPGKGYAVRGKNGYGTTKTADTFSFTGTPNNGDAITVSVQRSPYNTFNHGFNLIGNPYPSGLSFEEFAEDNSASIKGTAWFWSNLEDNFTQTGSTNTKHNNYAVYTLAGGSPPTTGAGGLAEYTPTGNIKVGQGFIVQVRDELASTSLVTRTLSFKNEMRTTGSGVFFNNPAKQSQVKDRYWLRFVSPENVVNTILLAHIEKATDGYDQDYDANLFTLGDDSFYSLLGTRKLQIQAKGAFVQESKIDLGTKQNKNGNYTIKLEQPEGIFANGQAVYLHDKLNGTYTNLLEQSFTFPATIGATENRFEIVYKNNQVLGTDGVKESDFTVYRDGANFVIRSSSTLGKIELYDLGGKLVNATSSTRKEFRLDTTVLPSGVYIIRAENSGDTRTKKIIK